MAAPAAAQQQEVVVEALAHILAAEDARTWDANLMRTAAADPEPIVRRHAALAMGRIGNRGALPILLELLVDRDSLVQADAAFALGLVGDSSAIHRLRQLVLEPAGDAAALPQAEAVSAVARIGGVGAQQFFEEVFARNLSAGGSAVSPPVLRALGDAWRLGRRAPISRVAGFAGSLDLDARWRAIYSLARLHAAAAADALLSALVDSSAGLRSIAVREMTASFADSARMERKALAARVQRLVDDPDVLVRIAALRALGTYEMPGLAGVAIGRLSDPNMNVRVQALATLGQLGGTEAIEAMRSRTENGPFALRRQALISLAQVSPGDGVARAHGWISDPDWRLRAAAAEALGYASGDSAIGALGRLVTDSDARVVTAAFTSLEGLDSVRARGFTRRLLEHADPEVRALAASELLPVLRPGDLGLLLDAYQRALSDPIPDARVNIVGALGRFALLDNGGPGVVADSFMRRFPGTPDYLVRRSVAHEFPSLARRFGPPGPIPTGMEIGDYREIARQLIWPADHDGVSPGLVIETDRGDIDITLFAADAPLTIHALLRLVGRRYFDGGQWHRVVPGFVAQDGDPRGDGSGGPGFVLRDEPSRRRFQRGVVGLALDGPDTGGSQFFITLAPQPYLDATYTAIGRVDSGMEILAQVLQGDRIRRIRLR
jgi:cyclophilin family peptidyl-prolyl cis-trans isomerase/HEAT repeat protein